MSEPQFGDPEAFIGSLRSGESGGMEIQSKGEPDAWIWTDSPATVRQ